MTNEKKFLDQEGLIYLWSRLSLQDYPNNETLMAVINAIDETKADKNELFSKDYHDLKNKPNIIDNQSDSLEIADVLGNVILKVNKDGISSTQLFLNNQNINNIIFNIDYKKLLAFDTNEIVFENELDEDTSTSAVLGIAVLSQMILGYE